MKNMRYLEVIKTYEKINPSLYYKIRSKNIEIQKKRREKFYFEKLKFPKENFLNKTLIEFGCGSGQRSIVYNLWGAKSEHLDFEKKSILNAKRIFSKFGIKNKYKIKNLSISDYKSTKKFDIVLSEGVIHHNINPYSNFKKISKYLKKGGYLILGVGNSAGCFQRMLARYIIFKFSKDEKSIFKNSKYLFPDFLKRASKFSGRTVDETINDTFIIPIWKPTSSSTILKWFKKNKIKIFNAYPNFTQESFFGDSYLRDLDAYANNSVKFVSELIWMTHSKDDEEFTKYLDKNFVGSHSDLHKIINHVNGIEKNDKINEKMFSKDVKKFAKKIKKINFDLTEFHNLNSFFSELDQLLRILNYQDIKKVKNFLQKTKYLFSKTSGLGLNYYIGQKC